MRKFRINPVSRALEEALQQKINTKTKPVGSLGVLEGLALRIGLIQQTLTPDLTNPQILVFAGDHGIVQEGVSAYPQEVTWQMVMNFIQGGAAINVFCKQHNITLRVVDAGVNFDFPENVAGLIHSKIEKGTKNFAMEPAMSGEQVNACIDAGAGLVKSIHTKGCNVIGFGEMGIGNTSSASAIMSHLCTIPVHLCVGRGTGLDDNAVAHKAKVLEQALKKYTNLDTPLKVLTTFGGFEIAQMVGAMLQAVELNMIILIDGFISSAAYLIAQATEPAIKDYCFFCHQSQEKGHELLLEYLNVNPILNLNMRLGEGTGAAVAYPILVSAVSFLNEMASFESARVSTKSI